MTHNRDPYPFDNTVNCMELFDALCERLTKADALAQITMTEVFTEHLNEVFRNYLWTLYKLIHEALEINMTLVQKHSDCFKKIVSE